MRPTGKLHLGNYVGALQNWVKLQDTHECFFFIADWHALTTDYDETSRLAGNTLEVVLDYLGAGLDPERCTIFVQSHVLQHAELHVLFSMITPLGWLERVPSYKEQQQQMPNKDLHMYGFLGYPLLQAADILIYRAAFVPVGEDQAAHVELTREVARRFNNFFPHQGEPVFPEPQVLLTPSPKLLGTDKRKMSKSYGNAILLSDTAAAVEEKIKNSVTDRPALSDRGSPERCPVGNLHQIFSDRERLEYITRGCTTAGITCVECKALAVDSVNAHLDPIRERRQQLAQHPERLREIIQQGAQKAAKVAEDTMIQAREAVGLLGLTAVAKIEASESDTAPLRVPESVSSAIASELRWKIRSQLWLERVKQYRLRQDRSRVFITPKGRKVGLYDSSRDNSGEWDFKLKDQPLNVLVLLVQDDDRYLHDYVLPPKFLQKYWNEFEREQGEKGESGTSVLIYVRKIEGVVSIVFTNPLHAIPLEPYEGQKHPNNYSALK
jgi:tryptophanyl-tRNA synthetase